MESSRITKINEGMERNFIAPPVLPLRENSICRQTGGEDNFSFPTQGGPEIGHQLTLLFLPHPQSRSLTAGIATHSATSPATAPPDSCFRWRDVAPLESFHLPSAPESFHLGETPQRRSQPLPDAYPGECPQVQAPCSSPARRP